jgi:hypothetical protein
MDTSNKNGWSPAMMKNGYSKLERRPENFHEDLIGIQQMQTFVCLDRI